MDVESVRFTDDYIGISTDTDIIQLTSTGSQATVAIVADVDVTGTMDVSSNFAIGTDKFKVVEQTGAVSMSNDAQTITHDGATSLTISSSEAAAFVKIQGGSAAYVQVESVKITDNQIGTVSDADLITLEDDKMSLDGALDLTVDAATITHTGSSGTPTLTISSTNGPVSVVSDAEYVDIEDVRFTGKQIGVSGDVDLLTLADGSVKATATLEVTDDVLLSEDTAVINHTAASSATAGLTISSTNSYVDVEGVRFNDVAPDQKTIGIAEDDDLLTLANADLKVSGMMTVTNDVKLSEDLAKITHTSSNTAATTGLTISSDVGFVDVEEVRFTNKKIGTDGNDDLLTLGNGELTITGHVNMTGNLKVASTKFTVQASSGDTYADGTLTVNQATTLQDTLEVTGVTTMLADLKMSKTTAALTHTATTSGSTTGLTIKSTVGFVDVEDVRFTDNTIGISADADLVTLATQSVKIDGKLEVTDDLLMPETNAALTHSATASGGLTIKSTNGYIDVEDIRFTGNGIGINGDTDIITLTTQSVAIDGKLDSSDDFSVATTMFTVDAQTGNTAVDGTLQVTDATTLLNTLTVTNATTLQNTLDVAQTFRVATNKFTVDHSTGNTAAAGTLVVTGATTLSSTLGVTDLVTLQDNIEMKQATSALTHSALTGGLAITSTNGYVDVEEARFTGKQIGIDGDETLVTLATGGVTITGTMTVSDNVKLTEAAAVIEHTSTASGAGLTIKSNSGYVDVESVRFTGDQIGLSGDTAIMQLTTTGSEGTVAIDGKVTMIDDVTSLTHTGATSLTISSSQAAAFVKIEGGSAAYVQVESVKITDNQIGTVTDADLITLDNAGGAVSITTGLGTAASSGAMTLVTVDAGANGDSGIMSLKTGAGGSTTGSSGDMQLATGDSATAGATGDVSITTGAATGGNGGDITLTGGRRQHRRWWRHDPDRRQDHCDQLLLAAQ